MSDTKPPKRNLFGGFSLFLGYLHFEWFHVNGLSI